MSGTIQVKIVRIGQASVEYAHESGVKVKDILATAGVDASGASLKFNGTSVTMESKVTTSGDLLISKAIQGA